MPLTLTLVSVCVYVYFSAFPFLIMFLSPSLSPSQPIPLSSDDMELSLASIDRERRALRRTVDASLRKGVRPCPHVTVLLCVVLSLTVFRCFPPTRPWMLAQKRS